MHLKASTCWSNPDLCNRQLASNHEEQERKGQHINFLSRSKTKLKINFEESGSGGK